MGKGISGIPPKPAPPLYNNGRIRVSYDPEGNGVFVTNLSSGVEMRIEAQGDDLLAIGRKGNLRPWDTNPAFLVGKKE